jgi:hypothetical protein
MKSRKAIHILVEGHTEEQFVSNILRPHLLKKLGPEYAVIPKIISTGKEKSGREHKGGAVTLQRIQANLRPLLGDSSAVFITTMFDLYGLGADFWELLPHKGKAQNQADIQVLAQKCEELIGDRRFLAYFSVHEFEALLFSDPQKIHAAFPDTKEGNLATLQTICAEFANPEDINHDNPPSKRLINIYPSYKGDKPTLGYFIADEIGLPALRQHCPHFDTWLTQLESTGEH